MKRNPSIAAMLVVLLAVCCIGAGCAAKEPLLAATVGEREITVQQLANAYNQSYETAAYNYGLTLDTDESIEAYRDNQLDSLIEYEMLIYQAELAGMTLTNEELASAKTDAEASYQSVFDSFVSQAEQAGATDPKIYANELFTDALLQNGLTVKKLKKQLLEDAENELLVNRFTEKMLEGVAYTPDELKVKYAEELETQKAVFDMNPSAYFTQEVNAASGLACAPIYVPDGFFRVRHILFGKEDETIAKLVKERLDAGEDFEALLAEFNTDPGMSDEANADGYLVGEGANYVAPFLNASLALVNDGDISDIVESDYGYHIIKRVGAEDAHEIPYEEVKEAFDAYMQYAYASQYYSDMVDAWIADETLVTRYPENYADVGKN